MSKKTFLWGVIPTVAATGHGLDKLTVPEFLDECIAGVVAALITVDNCFIIQRASVLSDKLNIFRVNQRVILQKHRGSATVFSAQFKFFLNC